VQDGMWISPHDRESEVVSLIDSLGVGAYAGVMVGRPAAGLDFRALASRAWDLDALDSRYRAFIDEFSSPPDATDEHQAFQLRTRLVHVFRRFPALDPELPDELIHAPAHRADAVALFHELYSALAPTAQRHFDAVTTTP
jgi:phenylacetic acid degradation operon negative regulatory protein